MKIRRLLVGTTIGILLTSSIVVYAITFLFYTKGETTSFEKKTIFQFDLSTGISDSGEIGPGDSFSVKPIIYNDATEEMYVFVKIQMPEVDGDLLYTFDVDDDWVIVESTQETVVYAYASSLMMTLQPGESTSALTDKMTLREISNAEYAYIDDINVTITGYAIGTEKIVATPAEAWSACKLLGNL